MDAVITNEQSSLQKLMDTIAKMSSADQDRLLLFIEGMAFKANQQKTVG